MYIQLGVISVHMYTDAKVLSNVHKFRRLQNKKQRAKELTHLELNIRARMCT